MEAALGVGEGGGSILRLLVSELESPVSQLIYAVCTEDT
jgi:hypothetical protein